MNIDAAAMASQLATYDVQPFENSYGTKIKTANSQISAYDKIKASLDSLDKKIYEFTKRGGDTIGKSSAETTTDEFFDLTVSGNVTNLNLDLFVEQTASSHQLIMDTTAEKVTDTFATNGTFSIDVNGTNVDLDLSLADTDGTGDVSLVEFTQYFNKEMGDQVTSSIVRTDGELKVMFSAVETGTDHTFNIAASADTGLASQALSATENPIKVAKDAIVWLGEQGTGAKLTSQSNKFENIVDGVTVNLKKPQAVDDSSVGVSIAPDEDATLKALNEFVTSYNEVLSLISDYTAIGSADEGRGVLASDSSIKGLSSELKNIIRSEHGGVRLYELGISLDRSGELKVDATDFKENIKNVDIDEVFKGDDGLFSKLEDSLDKYTDFSTGIIKRKKEDLNDNVQEYNDQLARLDDRYNSLYDRYLAQFTQLNSLQSSMDSVLNLFI
ncbi:MULTISPECIES: flagellar filament capping protein FliD [Vibrio]|uniref:flagellar filament capping protein FliD n=1 Tax=Vibrio TaxID=662 RepID=UPI000B5C59A6|nr:MULTISPECIES: flagellar filament capping protein FliD [Vibrio]HBV76807.1 flagellar hook protein FliD [Vibrio sp.]